MESGWNSNGFQWKLFPEAPGFQLFPSDSVGFHWIPLEFQWNWKPEWLRLQPSGFHQNSDIPLGIRRIPPELMGEGKDLKSFWKAATQILSILLITVNGTSQRNACDKMLRHSCVICPLQLLEKF